MEGGVEFLGEFLQLFAVDIADGKELETLRSPASNVESLNCLEPRLVTFGGSSLRNEEIDHVCAASIDNRGDGLAVDVVKPSAEQCETLRCQVYDRRCDIDLAVEPWFDCMLVARLDVGEVVGLKRAHMRRHNVAEHALILIRSKDCEAFERGAGELLAAAHALERPRAAAAPPFATAEYVQWWKRSSGDGVALSAGIISLV